MSFDARGDPHQKTQPASDFQYGIAAEISCKGYKGEVQLSLVFVQAA